MHSRRCLFMLMTLAILAAVSAALLIGALWGVWRPPSEGTEGFLIALAGGALIVSVMSELVEPASEKIAFPLLAAALLGGAVCFVLADRYVMKNLGAESGGGLLLAVTLDGIPENLALGVALIGADPLMAASLAGSIFLSNLPEAAGGARGMVSDGISGSRVLAIWTGTAVILALAALAGKLALANVGEQPLAIIRTFAGGVVAASLATEVFPKAYREDKLWTGLAIALGLLAAHGLSKLG
ncbi:ZIP family metal transporter [Celeribacter indicus]|uniref:Putative divalent heavy-metal cations transporter n=1 Tax=Celeribacter indicus TaxID=1208324 RepID=A0A0B5DZC8_9RHOB|nr:zinc transporter [Celeribacter indicus]AJE48349.1 putative divalent heavy-metal cations transporter [Celeribacter indicus]SDW73529.1 zinc transporter, ZIP family [Celeribacter indicus]